MEVGGPDAEKINAAHAAKALRAREEKVPEAIVAGIQKVVRETANAVRWVSGHDRGATRRDSVQQGPNRDVFKAMLGLTFKRSSSMFRCVR